MKPTYKMKLNNIIEFILKYPNFPWLLALGIPIVGLILSFNGYETAFLRSGATMVVFAVTSAYLNHYIIEADRLLNDVLNKIENTKNEKTIQKVYKGEIEVASNPREAQTLLDDLKGLSEEEIKKLQKIQKKVTYIEFLSGVTGTIIWGFGDLFFPVS